MSNKRWSDVSPVRADKDDYCQLQQPKAKGKPGSADFKQHPHHTGPRVSGPGEVPKAP